MHTDKDVTILSDLKKRHDYNIDSYFFGTYLPLLVTRKHFFSIFFRNSEAKASKFLENVEEMFSQYYKHQSFLVNQKQKIENLE